MTDLTLFQSGAALAAASGHGCPAHMTYAEAGVVGLIQGVSELFPVSSLGHNVLIPALVGGCWAKNLNVAASESPYLAFIVGLHVATALALLIYFWRDWVRIIGAFFTSFRQFARPVPGTRRWQLTDPDERLAWWIVIATIPVGLAGLKYEHEFRVVTGHAITAAYFLIANGLILLAAERFRPWRSRQADEQQAAEPSPAREPVPAGARQQASGRHAAGQQAVRREQLAQAIQADQRLSGIRLLDIVLIGCTQILALLAGISRDGVVMAGGMFRGLSRQDAARFSFLLATPVILAAGALKIPDLMGPLGNGVRGQVIFGSILSGIGAYLSVRFLVRYFRQARSLSPFAVYCLVVGIGSIIYLQVIK
jgi:undecaprenyl-diphosphatase